MKRPHHWMPLLLEHVHDLKQNLTHQQAAAWLYLVAEIWRNGGHPLPDDDHYLAKVAGMDIRVWRKNRAAILQDFSESDANMRQDCGKYAASLQHACYVLERQRCKAISEQRRAAANSRWNPGDANASKKASESGCKSNARPVYLSGGVKEGSTPGAKSRSKK